MKSRKSFTLVEILVCLLILGLASSVIGVQIRSMVADHTFNKNLENLLTDLRKCQLVATCDQTDIEVVIAKEGKHYTYWIQTDDPLPYFVKKKMIMTGVEKVVEEGRPIKQAIVHFYPSGRFDEKVFHFYQNEEKGMTIDMETPSIIELNEGVA